MQPPESKPAAPFSVALVGGGITGICLTIALLRRDIHVRIYEQAPRFTEIGAGIAFTPNAQQAMRACSPALHDTYRRVATGSGAAAKKTTWYDWVDSYHEGPGGSSELQFSIERDQPADGCHRAHFLEELLKLVPDGVAFFNKRLEGITEPEGDDDDDDDDGPLTLRFEDGTTAEADVVIGCDGIKSRVRRLLVGDASPQAAPGYSHRYAYRGLVPMDDAVAALGPDLAANRIMHMGPGGHILTFPVAHGKTMNVVAFRHDPAAWPGGSERLVVPTTREEAQADFADWGPNARAIVGLLRGRLDKWAIFDLADHPLDSFHRGRVALAGDAAHASSPHHGAGAGFCIEDAAVLAELLRTARDALAKEPKPKPKPEPAKAKAKVLADALCVFNAARRERTQWLVLSSRASADLYEWMDEACGRDPDKIRAELLWRNHRIWDVDVEEMAAEASRELAALIE